MNIAITIIASLLVFGFLIFIHEFGHYITARIFHVTITEFSIGMGPALVTYDSKRSGIRYKLAMFPIGGYVAMEGEDEESSDPNAFNKKPAWQRLIITSAGALVNLIFGLLAMFLVVGIINIRGTEVVKIPTSDQIIAAYEGEEVLPDLTNRSEDFLLEGDVIVSVNGKRVVLADELSYEIMRGGNKPVTLVVNRSGEVITLENVSFPTISGQGQQFGFMDFITKSVDKNFGNFFTISFRKTALVLRMCYESIFDLITGRYSLSAVSGPVGISGAIGDAVSQGFASVLNMVVIISINLGFMNLLPIPALDGGRIITILVEMVTRKKIPAKVEAIINGVGLAVLLLLSVVIMIKDVFTLF